MKVFPHLFERPEMVIFEILSGAIGFSIDIVFQDGVDSFGSMRLSCCEVLE